MYWPTSGITGAFAKWNSATTANSTTTRRSRNRVRSPGPSSTFAPGSSLRSDQEHGRCRKRRHDGNGVKHGRESEPPGDDHRGERGGDVARVVPPLVLTHHPVNGLVAGQRQCECAQERNEERLSHTAEEHQCADGPPAPGHERQDAEAQSDDQGLPTRITTTSAASGNRNNCVSGSRTGS